MKVYLAFFECTINWYMIVCRLEGNVVSNERPGIKVIPNSGKIEVKLKKSPDKENV